MIDHVWTVVCTNAVIDRNSNNVSLHNVIEQVTVPEEPEVGKGIAIPLEIVTLWARSDFAVPAHGRGRFTFIFPSGESVIGPIEFDINLTGEYRRYRSVGKLDILPAETTGRHMFRIELQLENETEWREVARIPLEIVFEPPEDDAE